MKIPLIVEPKDSRWLLVREVLKCIDSRRFHQEMSKVKVRPVPKGASVIKVSLVAMFFSQEISYVVSELKKREELRKFLEIEYVPEAGYITRFLGRFTENQFYYGFFGYLNSLCGKRSSQDTLIIDSTDIQVDLNWFKKYIRKKDLQGKDFAWGYSSSKGYYIGYKATLVVEYPRLRPVYILMHRGSPSDARMFLDILEELKRKRILRRGDTLLTDRGYCSYKNYEMAFSLYQIIPLIFPKKNMRTTKIVSVSYPLTLFSKRTSLKEEKQWFKNLARKFEKMLRTWKDFKPLRSRIEDVFKLLKTGFFKEKIHRYTRKSCFTFVLLGVLLSGIILNKGFHSKKLLQTLAEG